MSIYQKFIDSARKQRRGGEEGAERGARTMRPQTQIGPGLFASTVSSTPISKQQYRRLIESSGAGPARPVVSSESRKFGFTPTGRHVQLAAHYQPSPLAPNHGGAHIQLLCSPLSSRVKSSVQIEYAPPERQASPARAEWRASALDDPVLLKWMQAMRFETELECLTALQARTLAIDEHSAGALSVRNSQVAIQEMRFESNFIIDLIDHLISSLPVGAGCSAEKFSAQFSELWTRLARQTSTTSGTGGTVAAADYMNVPARHQCNQLTIINCTPRKSALSNARTLRPLDKLAIQIRTVCLELARAIENCRERVEIDSAQLEASLRQVKELYGKFVEISIRAECANIVRALDYDFSNCALNRLSSSSSLRPARPFESSAAQLPLKWALIALWQLTKDDNYLCRTLTEKWQTTTSTPSGSSSNSRADEPAASENSRPRAAKRLDYSTHGERTSTRANPNETSPSSFRSDYEKLYQICQGNQEFKMKQEQLASMNKPQQGALSSALESKRERPIKQVSTIELLIDVIISQPNKHERIDMMSFVHSQASNNKLIDLEGLDQSVSAAIYTSNQYKVAALRILSHLCVNEQAIKTILKCLSTRPPSTLASGSGGHASSGAPENRIIKSIFECYQTAQEHIYQNDIVFNPQAAARRRQLAACSGGKRKRARQLQRAESGCSAASDEFSDYGSRQTNSGRSSSLQFGSAANWADQAGQKQQLAEGEADDEEGDDAVVAEAIRLLIRLTSPFHQSSQGHDYYNLIGRFSVDSLVRYLSNVIKSTRSREMLLLSLSALANISFITTEPMKTHGTNRIVLELFRASKVRSKDVELRDQAVTIMANAVEKNLMDIVSNGGLGFLLSCLEVCPTRMANYKQHHNSNQRPGSASSAADDLDSDNVDFRSLHEYADVAGETTSIGSTNSRGYHTIGDYKSRDRKPIILGAGDDVGELLEDILECACDHQQSSQLIFSSSGPSSCLSRMTAGEQAAMERIHQKTAVALARMASDPITTRMVLKYGGIKQMIDLCKYDKKRNYSDTVLIACIAALRRMATVIGRDIFRNYNALDLIELDPKSALKIYGSSELASEV